MRVLDVGCGDGDVSLLVAELVGRGGAGVGVDRGAAPIEAARRRASEAGLSNIEFRVDDLNDLSDAFGLFDAIVGRRVLMYQADAVLAVAGLTRRLRPGGLAVFHEHDMTMTPASLADMPLHRSVQGWIREALKREGADLNMGFHLYEVLTRAGVAVAQIRAEAIVQTPTQPYPLASIARAMVPKIVEHGVASANEIGIDTLEKRLDRERVSAGAVYVGDMMFGAWARKPG